MLRNSHKIAIPGRKKRLGLARRSVVSLQVMLSSLAFALGGCVRTPEHWTISASASSVPTHDLLELSFRHGAAYSDPFLDVSLQAELIAPDGSRRLIRGFHHSKDLWMIRFRPDIPGAWTYRYRFTARQGFRKDGFGSFHCTSSDRKGGVRPHPVNPYRWVFSNGQPYLPIGLQDCIGIEEGPELNFGVDGEGRNDGSKRILNADQYFSLYSKAGFNLLRFSQRNCSYSLYGPLDRFLERESLVTDKLLATARKHGFRVFFGFFGYHGGHYGNTIPEKVIGLLRSKVSPPEGINDVTDNAVVEKEKRFLDYAVARWGVYADFWELLNERKPDDRWVAIMADYVRSIDPDRKPISTSWERPHLKAIDINTPHWYESEKESDSDLRIRQQAEKWKAFGKPVIVGEHGNSGMNWDPKSGVRMRVRLWTALFQEISLILWNTSWSKAGLHRGRHTPGQASNIYLGPEERGYIRALTDFSARLDADVRMAPVVVSPSEAVRGYGLRSPRRTAVYLHHFATHERPVRVTLQLDIPAGEATWIDPSTGRILQKTRVRTRNQQLQTPEFRVDLALLVE